MSSDWVSVVLAAACGVIALVFLTAAGRVGCGRLACLAHAAMGLGMVGMFVPAVAVVPGTVAAAVFGAVAAWFLGRRLRGHVPPEGDGEAAHLVIAPVAMAVMYLDVGGDMGGMDMGPRTAMGPGSPLLGAGMVVLAAYFVGYAGVLARRLVRTRSGAGGARRVAPSATGGAAAVAVARGGPRPVATRAAAVAHSVMCVLMAVMLVGAV